MKKLLALLLAGCMVFAMTACGGTGEPTGDSSSGTSGGASDLTAEDLKIGCLIPGSPTDGGFSQRAVEAMDALEEEYPGCTTSVVQAATAEEIKQEAANMADDGYNIIFGHGGQCSSPFAEICGDYPDVWFGTMGGDQRADNLFDMYMQFEQVTYILGYFGGLTSETGTIAWQTGGDYASYTKTTYSYELGAKDANPDIEVLSQVLSSTDPTEGYETALSQIEAGASLVLSNSNEAQSGAIKACKEKNVYTAGCIGDFTDQAPDQVVMNMYCNYTPAYIEAVRQILEEGAPAQQIDVNPNNFPDALYWEWNDTVKNTLDEETITAVEDQWQKVLDGEIDIPDEFEYQEMLNSK